jgi:hypothetical protein
MTCDTQVLVSGPADPRELLEAAVEALAGGRPGQLHQIGGDYGPGDHMLYAVLPGGGARVTVHYSPGGRPLTSGGLPRYAEVHFTTEGGGPHSHDQAVTALGQWLGSRHLSWCWRTSGGRWQSPAPAGQYPGRPRHRWMRRTPR